MAQPPRVVVLDSGTCTTRLGLAGFSEVGHAFHSERRAATYLCHRPAMDGLRHRPAMDGLPHALQPSAVVPTAIACSTGTTGPLCDMDVHVGGDAIAAAPNHEVHRPIKHGVVSGAGVASHLLACLYARTHARACIA